MSRRNGVLFDVPAFIAKHGRGTIAKRGIGFAIFSQGDPAHELFYIVSGLVKVTYNSESGREAIVGLLGAGNFFGEACLLGDARRTVSISTASECEIASFEKTAFLRVLDEDGEFCRLFVSFLLDRCERLKTDLVDQLINSSEERLARLLISLAEFGDKRRSARVIPVQIDQETLAKMVGTTRSRVNVFMNRFRRLGYIDYDREIEVRESLWNIIPGGRRQDC